MTFDRSKPQSRTLAQANDPLVLPDGTRIEPDRKNDRLEALQQARAIASDPATFKPKARRSIVELPEQGKNMNAIALVFTYTLLGLSNAEIADALNTTTRTIEAVKQTNAYEEVFLTIKDEFVNANSSLLESRIAAYSHLALDEVVTLAAKSDKESIRLSASTDILDRAGVNQKRFDERNQQQEASKLNIVITNAKDTEVNIDMNLDDDLEIVNS